MTQTRLMTGTEFPTPSENISIPIGTVKTIEHYLGSIGILDFLDTLKCRGVSMRDIIVPMCTHALMGNNSMSKCSEWLDDPSVRKELGLESDISQRTINRAVSLLGDHSDEALVRLWEGLDGRYRFDNTDVSVDGSAIVVNGPKAELGALGCPRDHRDGSRKQAGFLTAQLQRSKIPFFIRAYRGNASDPEQYRDALPDIFSMICEGSWIIMDNGGAAGDILDSIVGAGRRYLTRVKLNKSDDERMAEHGSGWRYVEDGVCCLPHTFQSSGRTTYLFFSADKWWASYRRAGRDLDRMIEAVRSYEDGRFRKSDFVTVKKNVLAEIEVRVTMQTRFGICESERDGITGRSWASGRGFSSLSPRSN